MLTKIQTYGVHHCHRWQKVDTVMWESRVCGELFYASYRICRRSTRLVGFLFSTSDTASQFVSDILNGRDMTSMFCCWTKTIALTCWSVIPGSFWIMNRELNDVVKTVSMYLGAFNVSSTKNHFVHKSDVTATSAINSVIPLKTVINKLSNGLS